jgi:toxin YoeB
MLRKINRLIQDIQRSPFEGIGKPEPLRHQLSGQWSRRIDEMNRIVYIVENDEITILQCGRHYSPH